MMGYVIRLSPGALKLLLKHTATVSLVCQWASVPDAPMFSNAWLDKQSPERRATIEKSNKEFSAKMAAQRHQLLVEIGQQDAGLRVCLEREGEAHGQIYEIGKYWQLIHYIVNGTLEDRPAPNGNVIFGTENIGPDLGYGPAQILNPTDVIAVAIVLGKIDRNIIEKAWDPTTLDKIDIYPKPLPGGWAAEDTKSNVEHMCRVFKDLSSFYKDAAGRGDAVLRVLM